MDIDPTLQQLITAFGEILQMSGLVLDEDGFCGLQFDSIIPVNIQLDVSNNTLVLFADLGLLPEERKHALADAMLRANRFWRATSGATLSLTDDQPAAVILALPLVWERLSAVELSLSVERFVNTAGDWIKILDEGPGETPPADLTPNPFDFSRSFHGMIRA